MIAAVLKGVKDLVLKKEALYKKQHLRCPKSQQILVKITH
jgi:hypothetical protein